jgi:phage tail protein X
MEQQQLVRALQGDTVDLICYRYYGTTQHVTEAVYEKNPGLAELGPVLPHGQLVVLPAIEKTPQGEENRLNLWD